MLPDVTELELFQEEICQSLQACGDQVQALKSTMQELAGAAETAVQVHTCGQEEENSVCIYLYSCVLVCVCVRACARASVWCYSWGCSPVVDGALVEWAVLRWEVDNRLSDSPIAPP